MTDYPVDSTKNHPNYDPEYNEPEDDGTISSSSVWNAIRRLGIDPYGVVSVHIDPLFVRVTRAEIDPSTGTFRVEEFPINRSGLQP
ncbi:hypothetical protein [Gordonia sp. 852002-10350_SCH5691597]|uniref:hypothetical protein n=1 Tax=Gordonia sp. 852002-10350_SCH5691597 TaxID=1834085 RepID=UPI0007EC16AB|nr:hypothetical protein [Gordonia sp. 852002-10350_SCH5691597]OBA58656.1 hypothetical protein A5777_05950 [Gordonia sp. 852002-10350_SCH5691597]